MKNNLILGVLLSLLGALFYSSQTALVKTQGAILPPLPVVIFIQSAVSLILMLPIIFRSGVAEAQKKLTTNNLGLHFLRSLFSLGISFFLFSAVQYIPLVNGLLLANTGPLIVPFIGYFFLRQKINHRLWLPILIGFVGVVIVLHPDVRIFNPASFLAIGAAVCMASTLTVVRKLSATDSTETIAFYFFLLSTLVSGIVAVNFWSFMTEKMLLIMFAIGTLYFLTQYAMTHALRYANAQLVGALFYANIIYAAIISQLIWHILPTMLTFVGMLLVIFGGILCIRVEQQAKQNAKPLTQTGIKYDDRKRQACAVRG